MVGAEVVQRGLAPVGELGQDRTAHVVHGVLVLGVPLQCLDEGLGGEDVVAHRGEDAPGVVGETGRVGRLLQETGDGLPVGARGDHAEGRRLGARDPDPGDGDARAGLDVLGEHLARVHPVHVVGAEHRYVLGLFVVHQVQRLEDRVGAAEVPARAEALLGGDGGDVVAEQAGHPPGGGDVPVQGVRLVLREDADPQDVAVDQVGQDEVDEPVGAAEGDRGFGAVRGQGHQAFALSARQHDAEHRRTSTTHGRSPYPRSPPAAPGGAA
ncbi:hypothetical protein STENM327S_08349 [Streptomyces tendae]